MTRAVIVLVIVVGTLLVQRPPHASPAGSWATTASAEVTGSPTFATPAARVTQNGPVPELTVAWTYPPPAGALAVPTPGSTPALGPIPAAAALATAASAGPPDQPDPTATAALVALDRLDGASWDRVTSHLCTDACTSTVFYYLEPGRTYRAKVTPFYAGIPGPVLTSPGLTLHDPCPGQVCVGVDAGRPIRPTDHAAQGLLHASGPGPDQAYLPALHVSMYREAVPYGSDGRLNWSQWPVNPNPGAQTTLLVSDAWWQANGGAPPAPTDAELAQYATWLDSYVQAVLASGHRVDFWEPVNEPGLQYYPPAVDRTVTAAELYHLFLVSYQVIKARDPAARIIGPSTPNLVPFTEGPYEHGFDMTDFLDFASAHHLGLAAINWHFNRTDPRDLADAVAAARRMVADRPNLGDPLLFVNEYGARAVQRDPGWDVAFLAAVTDSGVASAGRSCWLDDCWQPDLDGLLTADGTRTLPDYYVRSYYGGMTGAMVATASSSDTVSSVASYDPHRGAVRILIGRGVGYTDTARANRGAPRPAKRARVTVTVRVPWPSGTVDVAEQDISGRDIGPYRPQPPRQVVIPVVPNGSGSGTVTATIPAFADGDAWTLTLTPAR